jgi:hypothetical protein
VEESWRCRIAHRWRCVGEGIEDTEEPFKTETKTYERRRQVRILFGSIVGFNLGKVIIVRPVYLLHGFSFSSSSNFESLGYAWGRRILSCCLYTQNRCRPD